jgi:putative redox protein
MECTVRWTGPFFEPGASTTEAAHAGMTLVAESGSGHSFVMDGAPEGGGRNLGPRPMEVVLLGTGGCTAYDVVVILRKSGQDVRSCDVRLSAQRADTDPKVFTRIRFDFLVSGRNVKPSMVERAIKLSHEKYCSASIMLAKTAELEVGWELRNEQGEHVASGMLGHGASRLADPG